MYDRVVTPLTDGMYQEVVYTSRQEEKQENLPPTKQNKIHTNQQGLDNGILGRLLGTFGKNFKLDSQSIVLLATAYFLVMDTDDKDLIYIVLALVFLGF